MQSLFHSPESLKMAPSGFEIALRCARMVPRWPQDRTKMAPRWSQVGRRRARYSPNHFDHWEVSVIEIREPQNGSSMPPNIAPRWPQHGLENPNLASRAPRMALIWSQVGRRRARDSLNHFDHWKVSVIEIRRPQNSSSKPPNIAPRWPQHGLPETIIH